MVRGGFDCVRLAPHFAQHDSLMDAAGRASQSEGVPSKGGDARRSISFVPGPDGLALVVAQQERVGALHDLTGKDEVGAVLLNF